ncbi:MAG TPA: patatin [Myxococcales bacterium]|nr:patatin [Myxococcales bacterium]
MDTQQTLREWLREAPFAMGMSSGFFGFFAHCGVLSVLEEEALLPIRATGSSAGALIMGSWSAGLAATDLRDELLSLKRKDFWDPGFGFGLLKRELFRQKLRDMLPQQSFSSTRVPLTLSVYDVKTRETVVLDEGPLPEAIQASCAFPFMFQPVRVQGTLYLDGGILDRPGLTGIPEGQRLFFHHLGSRSPWRRKGSQALKIPQRDNMTALIIDGLPRVNPFKLHRGKDAFQIARESTQRALDMPISNNKVHVIPPQIVRQQG